MIAAVQRFSFQLPLSAVTDCRCVPLPHLAHPCAPSSSSSGPSIGASNSAISSSPLSGNASPGGAEAGANSNFGGYSLPDFGGMGLGGGGGGVVGAGQCGPSVSVPCALTIEGSDGSSVEFILRRRSHLPLQQLLRQRQDEPSSGNGGLESSSGPRQQSRKDDRSSGGSSSSHLSAKLLHGVRSNVLQFDQLQDKQVSWLGWQHYRAFQADLEGWTDTHSICSYMYPFKERLHGSYFIIIFLSQSFPTFYLRSYLPFLFYFSPSSSSSTSSRGGWVLACRCTMPPFDWQTLCTARAWPLPAWSQQCGLCVWPTSCDGNGASIW